MADDADNDDSILKMKKNYCCKSREWTEMEFNLRRNVVPAFFQRTRNHRWNIVNSTEFIRRRTISHQIVVFFNIFREVCRCCCLSHLHIRTNAYRALSKLFSRPVDYVNSVWRTPFIIIFIYYYFVEKRTPRRCRRCGRITSINLHLFCWPNLISLYFLCCLI